VDWERDGTIAVLDLRDDGQEGNEIVNISKALDDRVQDSAQGVQGRKDTQGVGTHGNEV
jgi:hypothetical protein